MVIHHWWSNKITKRDIKDKQNRVSVEHEWIQTRQV